jgi:hypothetical protein
VSGLDIGGACRFSRCSLDISNYKIYLNYIGLEFKWECRVESRNLADSLSIRDYKAFLLRWVSVRRIRAIISASYADIRLEDAVDIGYNNRKICGD